MTISFVDLAAQQDRIRPQIESAIARVLAHGKYIMGPEVAELEAALADYCSVSHAISVSSGTDALLIALMALGVGPGDAVLCPDFTYTATPEAIALLSATPVFVDVDPVSYNIAPEEIEKGMAVARSQGLALKGVIAVDLFGQPADYGRLETLAKDNGLFLICDGAQSFGAACDGKKVGQFGDVTTTSFFPAKPLGCYGDGGAIFTNDPSLAERMRSIRLHGQARHGGKYEIERIGVNGRLDTIQAAILLEKLKILDDELVRRDQIALRYSSELSAEFRVPVVASGNRSAWAQYTLRGTSVPRDVFLEGLKQSGIPCAVYYPKPLHKQVAYSHFPCTSEAMPCASDLAETVFSLPIHPYLAPDDQERIIETLNRLAETQAS